VRNYTVVKFTWSANSSGIKIFIFTRYNSQRARISNMAAWFYAQLPDVTAHPAFTVQYNTSKRRYYDQSGD